MRRIFQALPLLAVILCAGPALGQGALSDREVKLKGIAASCVAFYQSAMAELDLPIEANEPKRLAFLDVFSALAKREGNRRDFENAFQRDVVMRTMEVTTIIQNDPEKARQKVLENLPKCDGFLTEMKTAAGLD